MMTYRELAKKINSFPDYCLDAKAIIFVPDEGELIELSVDEVTEQYQNIYIVTEDLEGPA
jgi:hypothetical protein